MPEKARPQGGADILALGFGTATGMWAVGYLTHLPGLQVPSVAVFIFLLAVLLAGGYRAGRSTARGWRGGALVGLTAGLLNLLILGGLLSGQGQSAAAMVLGIAGSLLLSALLGALGAALGASRPGLALTEADWTNEFVKVAATTTVLLIFAGGLVTSVGAGLAVPDWPSSYGHGMFFYPLSRMTGGIYFEHAHRLLGSLVGLTTLVLLIHLARGVWPVRIKGLAALVFLLVCVQGVLGGLRVTDKSVVLAAVHGITAQLIFALLVALVVLTSRGYREIVMEGPLTDGRDLGLSGWLLGLLVVQLILGTIFRQGISQHNELNSPWGMAHVGLALALVVMAVLAGLRASRRGAALAPLGRAGKGVLHVISLQFILGVAALVLLVIMGTKAPAAVIAATLHQTNGALLLGAAVRLYLWIERTRGNAAQTA